MKKREPVPGTEQRTYLNTFQQTGISSISRGHYLRRSVSELSTDVLALSSFPDQSTRTVLVKKVRKDPSKQRTRWKN